MANKLKRSLALAGISSRCYTVDDLELVEQFKQTVKYKKWKESKDKKVKNLILPSVSADEWSKFKLDQWAGNTGVENVATWSSDYGRMTNEKNANDADLAVGFGDYLVASTGTVTVTNSAAQGRGFVYLPTRLLLIVPKSGLVRSTRQAVEKYDERFAGGLSTSAINFISGPSNSGDIEMELVVGVHGPVECTYLVVEDL